MQHLRRRKFLSSLAGLVGTSHFMSLSADAGVQQVPGTAQRLKTSLNAYSFNAPLMEGKMTLDDLLGFCAQTGFDGVDITGYYFKGYPAVPSDEYLFHVKRKVFSLGLGISGTGVRNDFTIADKNERRAQVEHVKQWIEVAAKIGAPVIRIFAGNQKNEGFTTPQVTEWLQEEIRTCVIYGKQHGVIVGLQNHNDFIQTADQVNAILAAVDSEWVGLMLDTGSFRVNDPYEEIAKSIKYAVNWQIKEKIFVKGAEVETDLDKVMTIIKSSGYNGYLPIETLGAGDPMVKVPALLQKLKKSMTS